MATRSLVVGRWLVGLWLVAISGCNDNTCDHPDKVEYTCVPVAPGTPNTCGPAMFRDVTYGDGMAFPDGCEIRLPMCVEAFPDYVQTCECHTSGGAGSWACPI